VRVRVGWVAIARLVPQRRKISPRCAPTLRLLWGGRSLSLRDWRGKD
jgi:hypothetical protein